MAALPRRRVLGLALLAAASLTGCAPTYRVERATQKGMAHLPARAPGSSRVEAGAGPPHIVFDPARRLRSISPLIYGLAGGDEALNRQVRPTLRRWGGNPTSRYNWLTGNAMNAARDWGFRNANFWNLSAEDRMPSGAADTFVLASQQHRAETLLTVPALGWVAKDDRNESASLDVPADGGVPLKESTSGAIAGYDPSANRARTSIPSVARARTPGAPANAVPQDEWIRHLTRRFGSAAEGGVKYYAIDNEPDLWSFTHTDVHPARMGYDAMLATFLEYAGAVKAVDPTAQVTGPVLSGWTAFFDSDFDKYAGLLHGARDRELHGGDPFLPWWLAQVRAHDERAGRPSLDVLDVHWYGTGFGAGGDDLDVNARRLRSTRSLWDPNYIDESWIARTYDETGRRGVVTLIPRLRDWIARSYPGTKIGITEWNWGADDTPNGALAIAEVLGIFGREGVDLAAYWQAPKLGSPGALAFQAYRNYDNHGATFGDIAIGVDVSHPDWLSCFASVDSSSGDLVAVVINKDPSQVADVGVAVKAFSGDAAVSGYRYIPAQGPTLRPLSDVRLHEGGASLKLPPSSITVLRLTRS